MHEYADSLELQLRLAGLSAEGFHDLVYELVKHRWGDAQRLAGADGGADVLVPGERRAYQAKRYMTRLHWGKCLESVTRAIEVHDVVHITLVIPRDFDWRGSRAFGELRTAAGRDVVDVWTLSDLRRLLSEDSATAARFALGTDARAVADLVFAEWLGVRRLKPTAADAAKGAVLGFAVTAMVSNRSEEPIYDVIVDMPPGPRSDTSPADLEVLAPQTETEVLIIHRRHPGGQTPAPVFGIPSVAFTDGRGRRWRRDHNGLLAADPSPVAPWFECLEAGDRRQDQWFDTWAENPLAQ